MGASIRLDRRAVARPANDNRRRSPIGAECIDCGCELIRHRYGDEVQCWRCGRWYVLASAFWKPSAS